MGHAHLMSTPDDLRRLGLDPGASAPWEVGRREDPLPGRSEMWHFEASTDDGTTTAVAFCLVGPDPSADESLGTVVNLFLTTPDGRLLRRTATGSVAVAAVGTRRCELPFGPHTATGDLTTFEVTVDPGDEGLGLRLSYEALVAPYRPGGTAHVGLHADDGDFHYAIHPVARCRVAGTVTADGRTWAVTGLGYHDHQWTDADLLESWHHWVWGRFHGEQHTVVLDDLVTSERFGTTRVTVLGVQDATGAVVLDHVGEAETHVETRPDGPDGRDRPCRSRYTVRDGARTVELDVTWTDVLVDEDLYAGSDTTPELGGGQRERYDRLGIRPSYARYRARATLTITDGSGTVSEDGEMICELNDLGRPAVPSAG